MVEDRRVYFDRSAAPSVPFARPFVPYSFDAARARARSPSTRLVKIPIWIADGVVSRGCPTHEWLNAITTMDYPPFDARRTRVTDKSTLHSEPDVLIALLKTSNKPRQTPNFTLFPNVSVSPNFLSARCDHLSIHSLRCMRCNETLSRSYLSNRAFKINKIVC